MILYNGQHIALIVACNVGSSGGHPWGWGKGGWSPPNNFRLAKCDAQFISSSSRKAIRNNVQGSILA